MGLCVCGKVSYMEITCGGLGFEGLWRSSVVQMMLDDCRRYLQAASRTPHGQ